MAIICPNIHHADWKKLVDAVGEAKAFLAFDRAQDIPTVEQAQRMFDARPSTETGRPKGNEPVEGETRALLPEGTGDRAHGRH